MVAKTTDGGETWTEFKLAHDVNLQEFGVGFIDETHGWVGGANTGMATEDGGNHWQPVEMGQAANKITILHDDDRITAYAVGVGVYKTELKTRPRPV